MKILHVNTIDTGGAAIAAIRLHELLLQNGVESKILFLWKSGKVQVKESYYFEDLFSSKLIFKILYKLNVVFNRRFTFYKPSLYFNGPDSLFIMSKHPLFVWAEVIHLHWVVKFLDWNSVFNKSKKKFVWTLHDMNPFTGGEHYKTGYNNEFKFASKRTIDVKKKAIDSTDLTIITPSEWMKNCAEKSEVFKGRKIVTVRNPIPSKVFNKYVVGNLPNLKIDKSKINLLFVAENPSDVRKGFHLLIQALHNIKHKEAFQLYIIGKESNVIDLPISHQFLGVVSDPNQLAQIYGSVDYFIIPSIEDNLPNTVSEALMCGTPVIGFEVGGIKEMIQNGVNGFLVNNEVELGGLLNKIADKEVEINKQVIPDNLELVESKILSQMIAVYNH